MITIKGIEIEEIRIVLKTIIPHPQLVVEILNTHQAISIRITKHLLHLLSTSIVIALIITVEIAIIKILSLRVVGGLE